MFLFSLIESNCIEGKTIRKTFGPYFLSSLVNWIFDKYETKQTSARIFPSMRKICGIKKEEVKTKIYVWFNFIEFTVIVLLLNRKCLYHISKWLADHTNAASLHAWATHTLSRTHTHMHISGVYIFTHTKKVGLIVFTRDASILRCRKHTVYSFPNPWKAIFYELFFCLVYVLWHCIDT